MRALAKKYHPDVNDAPNAAAFFRLIQEAYETLSDPRKRDEYVGSFGRRTCKRIITWRLDMVLGNIWIRFSHFPYGT
ncbi:DnaJ domain-containing protein [Caproicibacter fermentans]|uniref:DnaJ domain-containing protein n=1 Tax=Caproicibacter fermentans TaxID=2576756 RepID=UPI0038B2B581